MSLDPAGWLNRTNRAQMNGPQQGPNQWTQQGQGPNRAQMNGSTNAKQGPENRWGQVNEPNRTGFFILPPDHLVEHLFSHTTDFPWTRLPCERGPGFPQISLQALWKQHRQGVLFCPACLFACACMHVCACACLCANE